MMQDLPNIVVSAPQAMGPMPMDLVALFKPLAELGAFGLLFGVLFFLLPRGLGQLKLIADSFVMSIKEQREAHAAQLAEIRRDAKEEREAFIASLDRNTLAMRDNTTAVNQMREDFRRSSRPD